jgi:hypothetical protein
VVVVVVVVAVVVEVVLVVGFVFKVELRTYFSHGGQSI